MSIYAMSWAWSLEDLSLAATSVLLALADQATDEGVCVAVQETIARKARCSVSTVKRHVAYLAEAGLLEVTAHGAEGTRGRAANEYLLHVGAAYDPVSPDNDDDSTTVPPPVPVASAPTIAAPQPPVALPETEDTGNASKANNASNASNAGNAGNAGNGADGGVVQTVLTPERGSHVPPRRTVKTEHLPQVDMKLVDACLPPAMRRVLGQVGLRRATNFLMQAKTAGWYDPDIKSFLLSQQFPPPDTTNPAGLAIWRIQQVSLTPPPRHKDSGADVESIREQLQQIIDGTSDKDLRSQQGFVAHLGTYGVPAQLQELLAAAQRRLDAPSEGGE